MHRRGSVHRPHGARHCRRIESGQALGAHHPPHRPRPGRVHGAEEARGVLLTMSALHTWLHRDGELDLLRFTTAGSVDDGKSTLIGRLLHDADALYEDHVEALKKAAGGRGDEMDFSLITDGLKAEREQGITIDVAYRYFSTRKRRFIIADTPGHEQYTRNMATGASTAELAVVLIDARLGVLTQSKRHAFIASLLGVPRVVVTVNKMDLVHYDRGVFQRIKDEYSDFAARLGFSGLT